MGSSEATPMHISISKEQLAGLPAAQYSGKITLVDTPEKAEYAADILEKEEIIGFDTETKPSFRRGMTNQVCLLQLSTNTETFLIRLNIIGLPERIKHILENEKIKKIGLSIHDDFHNLHKKYELQPANFIDLQTYVKDYNIADNSLSRIYGIIFNLRISKGQRLSNWEAPTLTEHQQSYAALDALACIQIYNHLSSGKFDPQLSQYLVPIPEVTILPQRDGDDCVNMDTVDKRIMTTTESSKKRNTQKKSRKTISRASSGTTRCRRQRDVGD